MEPISIRKLMKRLSNGITQGSPPPLDEAELMAEMPEITGKKDKAGWVSPSYNISRAVKLDQNLILTNRCVAALPNAPEVEYYRMLRTRILQASQESGGNTVMITSALPGEGKTLTAINLALTFAKEFSQTALLVDCDLKQQKIREILGFESDKGLVDHLLHEAPLSSLMVWPGIEKLTLISGGRTIAGTSELLGSHRMRDVVADMKNRYPERYVFFDVPPVLSGADALCFAPLVDHILLVVQSGITSTSEVKKALQLLPREKVIGLVLNRQEGLLTAR
ncbi:MAG: AAA family ATPase [Geobacteraceae bacterium]|nr:AAA family ATPase [Geobacteraceae bacterium]